MVTVAAEDTVRYVAVGVDPGELLLESIEKAIAEHDIQAGMVVSGIGTLKTCSMHYITHTGFPPSDKQYTIEKPIELLSVSGLIVQGKPHLHIQVSVGEDECYGGHLEPGSEVLYLAEIGILKCNGLKMKREKNEKYGTVNLRVG
jgi:predicted DNA-binding protein with PD1-like motif